MDKLIVSNAPHIHTSDSSRRVMLDVVIALLPATVAAVVIFGTGALKVIAACVIGAILGVFSDWAIRLFSEADQKMLEIGSLCIRL